MRVQSAIAPTSATMPGRRPRMDQTITAIARYKATEFIVCPLGKL